MKATYEGKTFDWIDFTLFVEKKYETPINDCDEWDDFDLVEFLIDNEKE